MFTFNLNSSSYDASLNGNINQFDTVTSSSMQAVADFIANFPFWTADDKDALIANPSELVVRLNNYKSLFPRANNFGKTPLEVIEEVFPKDSISILASDLRKCILSNDEDAFACQVIMNKINTVLRERGTVLPNSAQYPKEELERIVFVLNAIAGNEKLPFAFCWSNEGNIFQLHDAEKYLLCLDEYYRKHPCYEAVYTSRSYQILNNVVLEDDDNQVVRNNYPCSSKTVRKELPPDLFIGFQTLQGLKYKLCHYLDHDLVCRVIRQETQDMQWTFFRETFGQTNKRKRKNLTTIMEEFDRDTYKEVLKRIADYLCDELTDLEFTRILLDYRGRCYITTQKVFIDLFTNKRIRALVCIPEQYAKSLSPLGVFELKRYLGSFLAGTPFGPAHKRNDKECVDSADAFLKLSREDVEVQLKLTYELDRAGLQSIVKPNEEHLKAFVILLEYILQEWLQ